MEKVNKLAYSLDLKNLNAAGNVGSPIKESYIVGEPSDYQLALNIAENGTVVLHDAANEKLYSNKKIILNNGQIDFE